MHNKLGNNDDWAWCPNCAGFELPIELWQSRPIEDALRKKLEMAMEVLEADKAEPYNLDTHPIIKRATNALAKIAQLNEVKPA